MKRALSICLLKESEDENRVVLSDDEGLRKVCTIVYSNLKHNLIALPNLEKRWRH